MKCARQDEEAARRDEELTTEEDVVQTSSPLSSADVVLQLLPTTATTIEREAQVLKSLVVLKLTDAHNTLVGVVIPQSQAPQRLTLEDLDVTFQFLTAAEEGEITQTASNDESNNAIIDDVQTNYHWNRNEEVILDYSCCTICAEEYKEGDFVCMSISCKHAFHKDCLLPWLMKNDTCPNFRARWIGKDG
jgi:hypothetical protein